MKIKDEENNERLWFSIQCTQKWLLVYSIENQAYRIILKIDNTTYLFVWHILIHSNQLYFSYTISFFFPLHTPPSLFISFLISFSLSLLLLSYFLTFSPHFTRLFTFSHPVYFRFIVRSMNLAHHKQTLIVSFYAFNHYVVHDFSRVFLGWHTHILFKEDKKKYHRYTGFGF